MMVALMRRARFARALRSRRFALLWSGQTISAVGDGAFFTAMAWQVLLLTGSAAAMGATLIAQTVPLVLFMLVGGVVADRLPRRLTLLWSDAGRAVVTLVVAGLGLTGHLQFWQLIALSALFGLAEAFFRPAIQSIPPELVPVEDLPSANALSSFTRSVTTLVGPAIGATLVSIASPAGAFAFDGLTFVISAACLLLMGRVNGAPRPRAIPAAAQAPVPAESERAPVSAGLLSGVQLDVPMPTYVGVTEDLPSATETLAKAETAGAGRGLRGVIADIREGVSYITGSTWLWLTIALASLGNIALAPLQVTLPLLVRDSYHQGVWLLGAILTAVSVGSIIATLVIGQLRRVRHRGLVAYISLLVSGASMALFGLPIGAQSAPALGMASGVLLGAGLGIFEIIWATTMQELVPPEKLGRVSSVDWLGSLCLQPIGLALVGALSDSLGPALIFIIGGLFSVALTLLGLTSRSIRALD